MADLDSGILATFEKFVKLAVDNDLESICIQFGAEKWEIKRQATGQTKVEKDAQTFAAQVATLSQSAKASDEDILFNPTAGLEGMLNNE